MHMIDEMELVTKMKVLRVLATLLLVLTVCLIVLDSQTKVFFDLYVRKASFKDLHVLLVLVCCNSAAAGYNVLQILRGQLLPNPKDGGNMAWLCYLMDQVVAYVVFATNSTAIQGSVFAITGQGDFQWMKLCDRFTRFCIQIAGALVCNVCACVVLAVISCISAYSLFRLYSSKYFLQLKHKY